MVTLSVEHLSVALGERVVHALDPGDVVHRPRNIFRRHTICQPEGRAEGAVKAVFARLCRQLRHITQAGQLWLRPGGAGDCIPAQPRSGGLGEWPLFWGVIDGVTFHLFHATPPSVIVSHPCDKALTGLQVPLA